jgi:hypothetical protein
MYGVARTPWDASLAKDRSSSTTVLVLFAPSSQNLRRVKDRVAAEPAQARLCVCLSALVGRPDPQVRTEVRKAPLRQLVIGLLENEVFQSKQDITTRSLNLDARRRRL